MPFDEVAETYDRARPEYPKEAFRELFHYLRLLDLIGDLSHDSGRPARGVLIQHGTGLD